ncbi:MULTISPECIES: type IV toxin-antitoxin system AbiEi family antitoxin domain-containing protein [unclassified Rhizobium]|uniref:type IV toxin-antitoxin system AbiEi family antitoxin domain-containing protein n=1 Tax=unclassified Rhizobium TaxID=2613769 RepID=UPI000BD35521|nr:MULTISPECIES: type IV toxin-antitoxin system AbiEi family antitoxin domain-containing protein [unclassified Rhizobium]MDH7805515.1 phage terminase Nu1 subunit (DNA packaging protein) [Rhizobium sp. AN67]MDQ4407026.1 type IV toxin-antitoxin system AbiEi family antitoxin domain-containing protein [Rhizobium sp. AN63]SOD60258.1 hypothetical protein SAMN05216595_5163 [Rhizobium sp. AN6A]
MANIPDVVTTVQMAAVLGIHERTLQKLVKDGWIEGKIGHDRWDMKKTVQYYATYVRLAAISGKQ